MTDISRELIEPQSCTSRAACSRSGSLLDVCMPTLACRPQGGDLFQYVKKRGGLREHEARWFFQQLIIGMDYCHRMGVVNRDIKVGLAGCATAAVCTECLLTLCVRACVPPLSHSC